MKRLGIVIILLSVCALTGCESLYYSMALDKPVYGKEAGEKFDRDAPDMLRRAERY